VATGGRGFAKRPHKSYFSLLYSWSNYWIDEK